MTGDLFAQFLERNKSRFVERDAVATRAAFATKSRSVAERRIGVGRATAPALVATILDMGCRIQEALLRASWRH